jgi:hypothetical protein
LEEIFSVAPPIAHYAPETKIAACSISPTLAEITITEVTTTWKESSLFFGLNY